MWLVLDLYRNSHPQLFYRISVLKNLTKLTATRLQWSYFLVNLLTAWNTILLTRESVAGVFLSILWDLFSERLFYRTPPGECICLGINHYIFSAYSHEFHVQENVGEISVVLFLCFVDNQKKVSHSMEI